ncbi:MAG: hypothetical protein ABIJ09_23555 [Pseudomonadota bacterium]
MRSWCRGTTVVLGVCVLLGAGAGCVTAGKGALLPAVPVAGFGENSGLAPLSRGQYEILDAVEGEGCVKETCFIGICMRDPDPRQYQEGGLGNVGGGLAPAANPLDMFFGQLFVNPNGTPEQAAERRALYEALGKVKDADVLIAPRRHAEVNGTDMLVFSQVNACVRVRGKALRLKTDTELATSAPQLKPMVLSPSPPLPAAPLPSVGAE